MPPWDVPSDILTSAISTYLPQVVVGESYANLNATATVSLDFLIRYSPFFDVYAFLDQAAILDLFVRPNATGDGSTLRQISASWTWNFPASTLFTLAGLRVPGLSARWRLTNNGGGATTVLEFQVVNRSS